MGRLIFIATILTLYHNYYFETRVSSDVIFIVTILTLLCFGDAKLVPLCLDLCTTWLIIKCILNINLFNMIVVIIVSFAILLFLMKALKKDSDAKKIEPLTFLINDFFP